jgi:diaminohydroxyphosphoribosylaminopyrimidine deaminase/5-amino-6-(5-phosphoribosylamino)uracil reductase
MPGGDDLRWMQAAIALAGRARGLSTPNPNVGCILVNQGRVVGRGWTQAGGRPHAEAMALDAAGDAARGATAYVTLEPCVHESARGGCCADALIAAGVAAVVIGCTDPDPRTTAMGIARLIAAGIAVRSAEQATFAASKAMAPFLTRMVGRAYVTLKLATSLDGQIALADGSSRWITGERARAHAHLLRAQCDAILVGRGTYDADAPTLNVRLAGLEHRSPQRLLLTHGDAPAGWQAVDSPADAVALRGVNELLVEGGAQTAAAFLVAGLVDRLILYRAPIVIGAGRACLADIGLVDLSAAHGLWQLCDARQLGPDRVEIYDAARPAFVPGIV